MVTSKGRQGAHGGVAIPLLLLLLAGCGTPTSTAVADLIEPTRAPTMTTTAPPPATPRPTPTASAAASAATVSTPSPTVSRTATTTPTARITSTPRPNATPTSARAATPPGNYVANFATWESGADPDRGFRRTYDRARDEYRVAILEEDQEWSFFAPEGRAFQDFTLDVEAHRIAGPDTIGYGLVFRRQARQEGAAASARYVFYLTPQGRYSLIQINTDGTQRTLRPLDAPGIPSMIAVGGGTNRLRATCQGAKITLAINDVGVFTLNDATITRGGEIGVFAKAPPGVNEMEVAFRRLILTPLR